MVRKVKRPEKAEKKPASGQEQTAPRPVRGARRLEKRNRMAEANKVTFILETEVRSFMATQAKAAGMDIAPYLQKVIESHVMANAADGDPLGERLKAKRAVLDYAVDLARKTDAEGGFDEHFIGNVMKKAAQDEVFRKLYDQAVGEETENPKRSARNRVPLNQQLGRLIKRAAGAKSKRDETGKILRAQVQGEILTTYTLLDKVA